MHTCIRQYIRWSWKYVMVGCPAGLAPTFGVLLFLAGPATAWEIGIARGMTSHASEANGGRVQVTCDPDRVFGSSSNGSVAVRMPEGVDPNRVVFLAETGEQAAFDLRDGIATEVASPVDWAALVKMMRAGGRIAVVTARDDFTMETPALPDLRC